MAEEKTRIVPHAPPKAAGESITFKCPNGHRLVTSATLAGKRGTCSKCGAAFVVPSVNHAAPGQQEPAATQPAAIEQVEPESPKSAAEPPPVAADGQNAFSELFGAVAAEPVPEISLDLAVGDAAPEPADGGGSAAGDVVPRDAAEEFSVPAEASYGAENPTAQLVARLWAERDHGGIVELHITGGSVILPEWFEPQWSRGTHGLFASQAADGTLTLTAVAWDSIQKIIVRQVRGLPDGMFE